MPNLRTRIETLEAAWNAAREDRRLIAEKALTWLGPPQVEQLLSALGAEREGRDLSESESAAKQAYKQAVIRECTWAGYPYIEGSEGALDIGTAIWKGLKVSDEELKLAISAGEAFHENRAASQEECAAVLALDAELDRCARLAGFREFSEVDAQEDSAR